MVSSQSSSNRFNQCSNLSFYDCKICYAICPEPVNEKAPSGKACFTFQYQSCQEEYCFRYATTSYNDGNTIREEVYCAEYGWIFLNEHQCTKTCSDRPSYTQFTNVTFMQFIAANEEMKVLSGKLDWFEEFHCLKVAIKDE